MSDTIERAHAANNLLNSEEFMHALTFTQEKITKEILKALTPEERESKWQEHHGLEQVKKRLALWAGPVRHNKEDST